jgi:predicted acyltransferase
MLELFAHNLGRVAAPVLFALACVLLVRWLAVVFLMRRGR